MMDVPEQQPPEAVAADAVGLLRLQLVYASERVLKMYVCRVIRKKGQKIISLASFLKIREKKT